MTKKIVIAILGIISILGLIGGVFIAQAREIPWSKGMRSGEIKALQEILKKDPTVYPEGYTTGYFGPLTERAIKKLQKKFSLPQTGIVDEPTSQLIFPYVKVKVISPNGGEVWNRDEIQTIKWSVATTTASADGIKGYFKPKASIDLFRKVAVTIPCAEGETCKPIERSVFVKHIATVNLFDMAYSWKISGGIKNGKDYIVRITVGRRIIPFLLKKKIIEPQEIWGEVPRKPFVYWDESDGTFEIKGVIPPTPTPDLEKVIAILEKITAELQQAIALLKGMAH